MEPNYNSSNQYPYHHQPTMFLPHPNLALNLNHYHDGNTTTTAPDVDDGTGKVPMFEKPLTPSDVGKLNRLVIPKQHAEKYFPLAGGDGGDKGLLLSFEDESDKCWRFRYSYWNSSQSYVLTKGWSRYVKEKQLDAGDVIIFLRHRTDAHRLFIGWRRRGAATAVTTTLDNGVNGNEVAVWSRAYQNPYLGQVQGQGQPTDCLHAGNVGDNEVAAGDDEANPRRRLLRLFGVNMECHGHGHGQPPPPSTTSLHRQTTSSFYTSNFMDVALSGDLNHMRNHRG